ncbi:hypothetical protein M3Y97_00325100 [Aphelenchoides bicaudatus]|nr:hypothetical protein M3Y97_00325100 [Aphelenchoides bicaudatus]
MERKRMYRDDDPTNPPQSKVVHVRNLGANVNEADLIDSLTSFGMIAYVVCMQKQNMALVEFEEMESARQLVKVSQENPVEVAGVPALFNYSTSQSIQRGGLESERPHHILALTISNATFPINARVLYRACSQVGQILRIAVMKRNYIQALVEFDSIKSAVDAKKTLNGADIYEGCCTLKAEFARPESVHINKQTLDQWDYTIDPEGPPITMRSDMLYEKDETNFPSAAQQQQLSQAQQQALNDEANYYQQEQDDYPYNQSGSSRHEEPYQERRSAKVPRGHRPIFDDSVVLMVYGVNHEDFDCDRMFNLLCCYGNVVKIKFLNSKPDTCMVQMGSDREANNVLRYLQKVNVFGTQISVRPSKSNVLHNSTEAFIMPNGTSSFADYTTSRNQRFSTAASAARNRIVYPSEQLHFFNVPLHYEIDNIEKLFSESGLNGPIPISIVPFHVKMAHSLSGLVTFESIEKSVEALMLYNHMPIPDARGDDPPILKLTTSSAHKDDTSSNYY